MIDWYFVAVSSLWISGAALLLSAWSYQHWLASVESTTRSDVFARPAWIVSSAIGLVMFCAGQALMPNRWWERILWTACIGLALARPVALWRRRS
jgi:hypothetical protein